MKIMLHLVIVGTLQSNFARTQFDRSELKLGKTPIKNVILSIGSEKGISILRGRD